MGGRLGESAGARWRRRLFWFGRHPLLWSRYVFAREVAKRDVLFRENPRFRDWRSLYRVAEAPLARLTGARPEQLRGWFGEIAPLQSELSREVGELPSAGAMMQAPLLYVLLRAVRPSRVVETGVSSGYSARLLLEAMARNDAGRLWSIGIQKIAAGRLDAELLDRVRDRPVGWLVPPGLRGRWELRVGAAEDLLPQVLADEASPLDMFIHDSLHLYDRMYSEYSLALPRLVPGGWLLSHDIHNNPAWPDFLAREGLTGAEELDRDLGVVRSGPRGLAATGPRPASG